MNEENSWASPDGAGQPVENVSGEVANSEEQPKPSISGHIISVEVRESKPAAEAATESNDTVVPPVASTPVPPTTLSAPAGYAPSVQHANPSTEYGANSFWGRPGFTDPFNAGKPENRLETSATWAGGAQAAREKRQPGWLALVGVAVAASLFTTGGYYIYEHQTAQPEAASSTLFNPEDKDVATPEPVSNSTSQNPDWEAVAKAVRPAVVAISVSTEEESSQGSGAIIDSNGHILTNNHVVASAAQNNGKITVELYDGSLYEAKIVGRDVVTDLAVIQLKNPPKNLTVVTLGNSDKLQVGQSVAAIGNPLGLSSTVTTGIVSALNRPVTVQAVDGARPRGQDLPFDPRDLFGGPGNSQEPPEENKKPTGVTDVTTNAIQVDAAVNPGNSGGPLFDARGRVIGVTSSIASLSGSSGFGGSGPSGSIGLGFAIPINQASMIANQLIAHGEAVHSALGVTVSEEVATVGKISRLGAKVEEVSPDGAAKKAGIKKGDIIVGVDDKQVRGSSSLVGWVRQYAVGEKVTLNLVRDGKEMKVSVTLQAQ